MSVAERPARRQVHGDAAPSSPSYTTAQMARRAGLSRPVCFISGVLLLTFLQFFVKVCIFQVSSYPEGTRQESKFSSYQETVSNKNGRALKSEKSSEFASRYTTAIERFPKMNCSLVHDSKELKENVSVITQESDALMKALYSSNRTRVRITRSINISDKREFTACFLQLNVNYCTCSRTVTTRQAHTCPSKSVTVDELLQEIKSSLGESSCGDSATLRGGGQKVVSFSVYGQFPSEYYEGLKKLLPVVGEMYPGWTVRVYLDLSTGTLQDWACSLACHHPHLDLCNVRQLPVLGDVSGSTGRVWRFAVMADALVDRYVIRDTDSPILQREVDAVNQWLSSGTCYHVMRDNLFHSVPMLAGMWGGCNSWHQEAARAVRTRALCQGLGPFDDQEILKLYLWPVARLNATVHDSYTCKRFGKSLPFPSERVNFTFVGQRSYRNRYRRERTYIACPINCRPKKHKNWFYC
ncbi:uncharacterized protein [Procambarus clarkii]|uniref:uncharacterized protein n=1 Tax=Procambarus clarkii TaxID=6728 RepID=UPI0037432F41